MKRKMVTVGVSGITSELAKWLKSEAMKNGRSVAAHVRFLLSEVMARYGKACQE